MSDRFKLFSKQSVSVDSEIRKYHKEWREFNKGKDAPFFALYSRGFKEEHLRELDGGALRLYLYFGFHANNEDGTSYHSIERIAEFFGVQTRTVDNWIKPLVERGLIHRERQAHRSNTTYLIPFSSALVPLEPSDGPHREDTQELVDNLVGQVQSFAKIYGEVQRVFHLFQWGSNGEKNPEPSPRSNKQRILILTKRFIGEHNVVTAHYHDLRNSSNYVINRLKIEEAYRFDSPYTFQGVPVHGIALSFLPALRKTGKAISDLIDQLDQIDIANIQRLPKVEYGLSDIQDIIDIEQGEENEE